MKKRWGLKTRCDRLTDINTTAHDNAINRRADLAIAQVGLVFHQLSLDLQDLGTSRLEIFSKPIECAVGNETTGLKILVTLEYELCIIKVCFCACEVRLGLTDLRLKQSGV